MPFLQKFLPPWLYRGLKTIEPVLMPWKFRAVPKIQIRYDHDLLITGHNADFLEDPLFKEAYRLGLATDKQRVLTGEHFYWRVHVLCWAAAHAKLLPGDFVECGVNTGIYARAVIHYTDFAKTGKTFFLLDTFAGMAEAYSNSEEMERSRVIGYASQSRLVDQVRQTFRDYPVCVIEGPVPDTLRQVDTQRVAFLSIDMNCVQPEVAALEYFWDKLVSGAVVVLDDYGYPNHEAQKRAHDEFARRKGVQVLSLPTCQGLILKP